MAKLNREQNCFLYGHASEMVCACYAKDWHGGFVLYDKMHTTASTTTILVRDEWNITSKKVQELCLTYLRKMHSSFIFSNDEACTR
jgi:hypothetical protein